MLEADWPAALRTVAGAGWALLPGLLAAEVTELIAATPTTEPERSEPGEQPIRHSETAGAFLIGADRVVERVARDLIAPLSLAAGALSLPPLLPFNEGTWNVYAPGVGQIGPHRDPLTAVGIIASITLSGRALFTVDEEDGTRRSWETGDGDVVLLRGAGWPSTQALRLVHAAGPAEAPGRTILTLRRNAGGAGAPHRY